MLNSAKHADSSGDKYPIPGALSAVYFSLRMEATTIMIVGKLLSSKPEVSL